MQETRNTAVNRNRSRNNPNNTAMTAKKSSGVKKSAKNAASVKRASAMHPVRTTKVVNIKKTNKAPFPWAAVLITGIFTVLFLFMMMNYAEVDKYRSELADLNGQIASMEKLQDELQVELSNKYDPGEITDYAVQHFGMVPVETMDYTVITMEQGDKTELHNYDDGEEGGFGFLLTGLGEVIGDFIN